MVNRILKFFTSLRLTVVLLAVGTLLVFVGTLAQVHEGLYDAQVRYFKSWFVWRPTIGDAHWPIVLPGGYLLGTLLLLNLVSAHIKRFQLTWKKAPIHLIHGGLIILLLGQLFTDAFSRNSAMRIPEGEARNYSEDFRDNELALIDASDLHSDRVISIPENLLERKGEIEDSALPVRFRVREYWPNCDVQELAPPQAVPAPADHGALTNMLVLPLPSTTPESERVHAAALVEVVSDKGSLGKYLVVDRTMRPVLFGYKDSDWAMTILFAPMLGGNQLVVADAARGFGDDSQMMFAEAELTAGKELKRTGMPVTLRIINFWPKCMLYHKASPMAVKPKLTQGALANSFVEPLQLEKDEDHRNLPAVVVEALGPQGSLGTWLLWTDLETHDTLSVAGKAYQLAFRFKRYYEPYSIGLLKFSHDIYKGTDTPKNFSSRIRLMNPEKHEDREVLIKMNDPLRYAGTTFYQSGFFGEHVTILQVVTNPSAVAPYLACAMVAGGLIAQFMAHLIGFMKKQRAA